jgi:hypothetical protein
VSHGGEAWCWDLRADARQGEYPIGLVDVYFHPPPRGNFLSFTDYAPDFPLFVFRCILETLTSYPVDSLKEFFAVKWQRYCRELISFCGPLLRKELVPVLDDLDRLVEDGITAPFPYSYEQCRARLMRAGAHPDEQQARSDFLTEHPTYIIERVFVEEQVVVAVSYRIVYRIPGDPAFHEELRQYLHADGEWHISRKTHVR